MANDLTSYTTDQLLQMRKDIESRGGTIRHRGFFSSGPARFGLEAGGQAILTAAALPLSMELGQAGFAAGATTGPFAPIAAPVLGALGYIAPQVAGAFLGGAAGSGIRRAGQALTEVDPQFMAGELGKVPQAALSGGLTAAGSEALLGGGLPVVGGILARGAVKGAMRNRIGKALMRGTGELFGVPGAATQRVIERGPARVLRTGEKPSILTNAVTESGFSGGVPKRITDKAILGLQRFRSESKRAFDVGLRKAEPALKSKFVNLNDDFDQFRETVAGRMPAARSGVVGKSGTLLGADVAKTTASEHAKLAAISKRLIGLQKNGGFLSGEETRALIHELDDMVSYSTKRVAPVSDEFEAIVKGLRRSVSKSLGRDIPSIAKVNAKYAGDMDIFSGAQPLLATEQSAASTIRSAVNLPNEAKFRALERLDRALPEDARFLDDVKDYAAGIQFLPQGTGGVPIGGMGKRAVATTRARPFFGERILAPALRADPANIGTPPRFFKARTRGVGITPPAIVSGVGESSRQD